MLYAKNEHQALEPASVTKVMTLLLVMEAIDREPWPGDDVVTVSETMPPMAAARSCLGEQITVEVCWKGGVRVQRQRRRRGPGGKGGGGHGAVCGADEQPGPGAGNAGHPFRQLHWPSGGGQYVTSVGTSRW